MADCKAVKKYLVFDSPHDSTPWIIDDPEKAAEKVADHEYTSGYILEVVVVRKLKVVVKKEVILETDDGNG
jgi:hypothetical protein